MWRCGPLVGRQRRGAGATVTAAEPSSDLAPGTPAMARGRHHRQRIQRAAHTARYLQHVGVNHGSRYITVSKQGLHRANIGAALQQMGGERVA